MYLDWKFTHESFNSFEPSNEFEERYIPISINVKKEEEVKPSLPPAGKSMSYWNKKYFEIFLLFQAPTKAQKNVNNNRKKVIASPVIKNEIPSDQESSNSGEKDSQRSCIVSSEDTNPNVIQQEINNNQEDKELKKPSKKSRGRRKSTNWNKKETTYYIEYIKKR